MGLDMTLSKKTYVKDWSFEKEEEKHNIVLNSNKTKGIKTERISHIVEEVAEWRKANQIHEWFVNNVQKGKDDCQEYYIDKEKILELVNVCENVIKHSKLINGKTVNGYTFDHKGKVPILEKGLIIKDPTTAKNTLPTSQGFFFGFSDYDEYYLNQVKETVEMLKPLLEEGGEFYYQSSW